MRVSDLTGGLLDYWVAKAETRAVDYHDLRPHGTDYVTVVDQEQSGWVSWSPSRAWEDGGPIIERERINLLEIAKWPAPGVPPASWLWVASLDSDTSYYGLEGKRQEGPTPLVAAMRAFVASKFGEEVSDAHK